MPLEFTKILTIPLGPIHIQVWGLMVAIGMLVGLWVALKEADRKKIKRELILDLFLWIVVASMLGGRLFYVLLFWKDFAGNPIELFTLWDGGLVFYGGVFAALLVMWGYLKWKKLAFWKVADALAPGLAIGIFFGRIGCYLTGLHIGKVMQHPWIWGSILPDDPRLRHEPSLYLSLHGLLIFLIVWNARARFKKTGQMSMLFLILYGIGRFILDHFRADDLPGALSDPRFWDEWMRGLTISQILSVFIVVFGIVGLLKPHLLTRK